MATAIRLTRVGKRGDPNYRIVVLDDRTKRDGRYIELLGTYNPNTNPATVTIDKNRYEHWLSVGAQPSQTVKRIVK